MQAKWGSHGHYEIIALSPSSPQEMFNLTIKAFNLAETYRTPVLVMADEVVGHTVERVVVPPVEEITVVDRRRPTAPPEDYLPYQTDDSLIPVLPDAGQGYHLHITGLTHDERGYPMTDAIHQEQLVTRLINKIRKNKNDIIDYTGHFLDDAELVIVTYGSSVRPAMKAMRALREDGLKVGLLKLTTVWPFPEELIAELAEKADALIVPEVNFGQICLEVERCARGRAVIEFLGHAGGGIHKPSQIMEAVRRADGRRKA